MEKNKRLWVQWDGVNFHGYSVTDRKPSGISGGGSMQHMEVVPKTKLTQATELIEEMGGPLERFEESFRSFSNRQSELFSRNHTREEFVEATDSKHLDFDELFKAITAYKNWKEGV